MKKKYLLIVTTSIILISHCFSFERKIQHSYCSDYSLFPEIEHKDKYIKKLTENYEVHYCVQSVFSVPKAEACGYSCDEILQKLNQLGGTDKECYGVSYVEPDTGKRKAIFKKSEYDAEANTLYIKDKAAGPLYFDVGIDRYKNNGNVSIVKAIVNKKPDIIFVRGIKKNEAEIFVLMQENDEWINVYALIQCSYNPLEHKIIKTLVESAVSLRVVEIQNWFYRMLCKK